MTPRTRKTMLPTMRPDYFDIVIYKSYSDMKTVNRISRAINDSRVISMGFK